MKRIKSDITLSLGRIKGDSYSRAYMQVKKIDRRLTLGDVRKKMVVLDVGGGLGLDDLFFAQKGAYPVVADLSYEDLKKGREICRDLRLLDNLSHLVADARHLPFKNGCFDVVTSFSAIEHLPKRHEFKVWIREMTRVLKYGGKFILVTSNKGWIMYPLAKLKMALKLRSTEHFFTPDEILKELGKCRLAVEAYESDIVFYRGYSLIPLPARSAELLENLLNRLSRILCSHAICGRMGFRCTKRFRSSR